MEQEPESPVLYNTLKRVGYKMALLAHAVFILMAVFLAVVIIAFLVGAEN